MRILHVVPSMMANGGGTSEYVPMVAIAQLQAGAEVAIAFRDCGNVSWKAREAATAGILLLGRRFDVRWWNPLRFNLGFCRMLRREAAKYDVIIVHCNWVFLVWWGAHVARKFKKPYFMMPHGSFARERLRLSAWKKRLVGWIDRHYARHAAAVWATAGNEAQAVKAYVPEANVEVFPIGLDVERYQVEKSGAGGRRTLLFFSRISPIKGLDLLAEAWGRALGGATNGGLRDRRDDERSGVRLFGREGAEKKLAVWLSGVTEESVKNELIALLDEKSRDGEYRFKNGGERESALDGACAFFVRFSRKIVQLSDGRCVYFAPDRRAQERNGGNVSRCWAEYAFHAVSSSGKMLPGKAYRERLYNLSKAQNVEIIERILLDEHCMYRKIDDHPENDAVIFLGQDLSGGRVEVVTRLDEYGNARANLGEVTVIVQHARKQTPPPKYRPLTEVVETVAKHQAAGFSPSTTTDTIPHSSGLRKGRWKLLIVGPDDRGYTEEIKKVFAAKCPAGSFEFRGPVYGDEKIKLLASADAFILPTRNENWGIAVAEAMASGLPVICTKGAPWSCLETEKAGRWVEVSADGIQRGLEDVLALSEDERRAMGRRGRKWVEENLDWRRIAKRMMKSCTLALRNREKKCNLT